MVRAKILFLANCHAEVAEDIAFAWRLDADQVVSLRECRKRFIEAYRALEFPSPEQKLVFAEIAWAEAATIMADQNTAQAFLLANSAAQVYESVVIHPLEYYSEARGARRKEGSVSASIWIDTGLDALIREESILLPTTTP